MSIKLAGGLDPVFGLGIIYCHTYSGVRIKLMFGYVDVDIFLFGKGARL